LSDLKENSLDLDIQCKTKVISKQ